MAKAASPIPEVLSRGSEITRGSAENAWCVGYKRSEEHTSELQSLTNLVCRLLLEKKKEILQQTILIEFTRILPLLMASTFLERTLPNRVPDVFGGFVSLPHSDGRHAQALQHMASI